MPQGGRQNTSMLPHQSTVHVSGQSWHFMLIIFFLHVYVCVPRTSTRVLQRQALTSTTPFSTRDSGVALTSQQRQLFQAQSRTSSSHHWDSCEEMGIWLYFFKISYTECQKLYFLAYTKGWSSCLLGGILDSKNLESKENSGLCESGCEPFPQPIWKIFQKVVEEYLLTCH